MSRAWTAGEPFEDDDEAIAEALKDVSVPALMMSMIHMTGDTSLLRGDIRPLGVAVDEIQGYLSPEVQDQVRTEALRVITKYRDNGCVLPPPPSPDVIAEMVTFVLGQQLPPEYLEMFLEDLALDGGDPSAPVWTTPQADRAAFPVVVIGCGESGIVAGIRLKQAGIPFTIIEKNDGPGGVWFENTYPGARVDIGNHFYSYSFEPTHHWTKFFAEQPELQSYLAEVMHRHLLEEHVRWRTEVVEARFDEATQGWDVVVRTADGAQETLHARAVISAVGQLNRPNIPDFPGRQTFSGPSFHSAEWDHSVDIRGKNVALVGAGASGFQIVPAIAEQVESLTVYQRTAQWTFPNPKYHSSVGDGVRWALRHLPFYGRWYRLMVAWPVTDGALLITRIDPAWDGGNESVSELNDLARQHAVQWIQSQVSDPELLAKVIPDYPATGKRTLQDNGSWLAALQRENVELVRDPIDHIDSGGITTADGTHRPADVIVYATGFHANRVTYPMHIVGRDGRVLSEEWGERPSAYLGITVPGFPNLFLMYGPATNPVHGSSVIFMSECQARYIMGCLDLLIGSKGSSMEPAQAVHDDYHARTQHELSCMVWSHPAVKHSYYKNSAGEIHTVLPWRQVDYWTWTRRPDPADYVLTSRTD